MGHSFSVVGCDNVVLTTRRCFPTFSPNLVQGEIVARDTSDLLHGTLDLLVLKALATQPLHGFGLSKWIEERTRNELEIVDSALYKALHRLEDNGAIVAEWGVSENNRKAKYYSLTSRGRQQLRAETATWKRYVAAISGVIETA
jgi:PadR family transcriptional regulator